MVSFSSEDMYTTILFKYLVIASMLQKIYRNNVMSSFSALQSNREENKIPPKKYSREA